MTDEEILSYYGHMSQVELAHELAKYKTLYSQQKAELKGQKAYNETLNRERRPVALENRRLKEELDKAIKRYESLKARVKAIDPKFQF